ncbi:MAG: histidine kinase, partial [Bacteroidetes bacterium]|nr:histidine kinase [Bacteroidota bacterium]
AASPIAIALFALDGYCIALFDKQMTWERSFGLRLILEVPTAALIGALLGALLTAAVHLIAPYHDGLRSNMIDNALIAGVLNIIITAGLEAVMGYRRSQAERSRTQVLEKENADIRFEVLKTQLNPHFLFNSLNVLSSLIQKDQARAQRFVDDFAAVYRYILEVIDLPLVEVQRELDFARSYLALQGIRFEHAMQTEMEVEEHALSRYIPPLALQTVLENAFKHNRVSPESPLRIRIESGTNTIVVRNNLQRKTHGVESRGVGLENLRKRYAYLEGGEPRFTETNDAFVVELPLLAADQE